MKKKTLLFSLALLATTAVGLSSCVKSGAPVNSTSIIAEPSTSVVETPSASQSQEGSETSTPTTSTTEGGSTTPTTSTTEGESTSPTTSTTQPETGGDEVEESTGFGTGYTSWSDLFAGKTRKDSKNRIYLGDNDTDEITRNGFTFLGKSLLDSSIMNTNGTVIKFTLPSSGTINMNATWGSSSDSGVIKIYNSSNEVVYTSTLTYSKDNSAVSLSKSDLAAGEYTIKAEKTNVTGIAGLKISKIYYSCEIEYVNVLAICNNDEEMNIKLRKGSSISEFPSVQKSGYKFIGWYTTPTFDVGSEFNTSTIVNDNITIYAKWEELSTDELAIVSFELNITGTSYDSISVEKGTTVTLPKTKEVDGYRFDDWYTSDQYTTKFVSTNIISTNTVIYGKYILQCTITYKDADGNVVSKNDVDYETPFANVDKVNAPYLQDKVFQYWVKEGTDEEFAGSEDITTNVTLVAKYRDKTAADTAIEFQAQDGLLEAAYFEFKKYASAENYALYKVGASSSDLTRLGDKNYFVTQTTSTVRIDVLGLTAGNHQFMVAPIISGEDAVSLGKLTDVVTVEAYDRSGYAHFNYDEGIGAYKDNGELKDNAIVLYVTDENKNTVSLTYGSKTVTGIGNILNTGSTNNEGILRELAGNNIPLVVRFVGCISESGLYESATFDASSPSKIAGLTIYKSTTNGGSVKDNGHMARSRNAKNLTLEGVGSNAIIDGWGFHFMSSEEGYGKSFEVRNLTFINTPEDAIGMEGVMSSEGASKPLDLPVERCWVHNNTFLKPTISNPSESDKKDGDGSCDFKRGKYFTCSYNYFENCHKTNLVGANDDNLQFNLTYHHNIWYNCKARMPLSRNANIHFYNNYIYGTTDTVSSVRASSYLYSEFNYYFGCNRPMENGGEGTGYAKFYGNAIVACYGVNDATIATTRDQQVSSTCQYSAGNIDYSNFDTNPSLFYYDSVNKKSNCNITDAYQARIDCIKKSGSMYRTVSNNTEFKTNVDITSTASSETISGAKSLTIPTGKGVLKVFTVTSPVEVTMAATGTAGFDAGYLLRKDGKVMLTLTSSDQKAVLLPGEYVVISCVLSPSNSNNSKNSTITKCEFTEFDSEELNQQLIAEYNVAHDAIPSTIVYTINHYNLIIAAKNAYDQLGTELQASITDYSDVTTALSTYKSLGESYVEGLINAIGTVDSNSGTSIQTARSAYNDLKGKFNDATISNYDTLTQAESDFDSFAVDACISAINAIGTVTIDSKDAIEYAEGLYNSLDSSKKSQVSNYSTLADARTTYDSLKKVADAIESLQNASTVSECEAANTVYNSLTASEKASISSNVINEFNVNYTIVLIDSISNPVTRADKDVIELARTIYDSLDSTYQAQVTNYSTLTEAEEAIAGMSAEQVVKTLAASNFNITGASTSEFNGNVWQNSSIVGISKSCYTDVSKVVLNATRYDGAVSFKVSYSLDGTTWSEVGTKQPGSNKKAEDLEFTISATGDLYIKIEIICTKDKESNAKQGTISSIKVTCYE